MEPMTLGSPVGSPMSSPSFGQLQTGANLGVVTTTQNNVFYPSYLMGESQNAASNRIAPGSLSPGRRVRQFSSSNTLNSQNSPLTGKEFLFQSPRIGHERQGGPPTMSLVAGLPQTSNRIQSTPFVEQHKIIANSSFCSPSGPNVTSNSFSTPTALFNASASGHQTFTPTRDMLHGTCSEILVGGEGSSEPLEDTWVTVYGFPSASASYVLTQFAQLGAVVDQRQPGIGNWMHLKYQNKMQARKALSKNGKVFNGNMMIGVVPCTDQTITNEKENISLDSSLITSPGGGGTPKAGMRPLTQAYHAARADIEVTPDASAPKKNDSLVSRAIQHILGV